MYELKRKDVLEDFGRFLRVREDLHEKTAQEHKYMAGKFLDYCHEVLPEKGMARDFKEKMMNEDYSKSHINNAMKAIQYYYKFHEEEFDFKRLKRPKKLPETLTENEVKRVLYACDSYRDFAIIKTLVTSGVRASELCNLNVQDVNLDDRKVRIRKGKGQKDGITMISEDCAEAISEYLDRRDDNKDPLFLSKYGERLTRSGLLQLVKRRARDANIEKDVNVHMFRHFFGTMLISNGADVSVVKELMRHEDIKTTSKYVHLSDRTIKRHYDRYME